MGILQDAADAFKAHSSEAREAFGIYRNYCEGKTPPRVAGMDTYDRLALRIAQGKSIEESAAREYLYRWNLAIKAPDQCGATGCVSYDPRDRMPNACVSVFGAPHTIGM